MSDHATGRATGGASLGLVTRVANAVMAAANVAATVWILFLMGLLTADVLLRNLFGAPIAGVPEMVKFSIVGIVFLQIAHTHRLGEMIRSDGLLGIIMRRRPRIGLAMDVLAQLAGMVVATLLGRAVWPKAVRAFERGEMEGVTGHFEMPVWPFLAIVSCGAFLLALSFLLKALALLARGPERDHELEAPSDG